MILKCIHNNQYGFLKSRSIQDCLAWAFEYIHQCQQSKKEIIILKLEEHGVLGLIVDEVKEVVTLGPDEIDKVAYDAKNNKSNFINGVGKHGEELISLFDTNSIIDETESV